MEIDRGNLGSIDSREGLEPWVNEVVHVKASWVLEQSSQVAGGRNHRVQVVGQAETCSLDIHQRAQAAKYCVLESSL